MYFEDGEPVKVTFSIKAVLTFDLVGGTLDGKNGTIAIDANVGEMVNLLGAPTREGYTFKCWKGSEYAAGAEYKVEGDHAFTAEWEKSSSDPDKVDKKVLPSTGDNVGIAIAVLATMVTASLLVLVAYTRRKTT